MKRIFILLLSVATVYISSAQSVNNKLSIPVMHLQVLNSLLAPQNYNDGAAMRTTTGVTMERVVAQSIRDNTLNTLTDSVNLKYPSGVGSAYDYNTMLYPYNYTYNTSPMFNYAGIFTRPQVLYDTLRRWSVDGNTLVYGYYETDIASYDANRNMTNYIALHADSSFYPNTIYANNFIPVNHNISFGAASNWVLGVADSAFKQYFKYNASNLLTADSTYELHLGVWRMGSKSYYTYDGSNNLTQIDNYTNYTDTSFLLPLVENLQYVNTYDGSHRLVSVAANYRYMSGLAQYTIDTFGYTGTHTFHSAWREYQYDTINSYWAPMFNMTKVLNGSGLPDTVNIQGFDSILNSWVPRTMDVVHYDALNNPDTLKDFEYNFTMWPATPNFTTKYYYQTYSNTVGINSITNVAGEPKIFPNPVANTFTITQLDVPAHTPVTISLLNISGQLIMKETMYWNGEAQISVNDLKPGVYWVVVKDSAGNIIHRQAVVKS